MLKVENISKTFRLNKKEAKRQGKQIINAVDNISFDCQPGTICGMLGTNGAGKSTTLRLLSTAMLPTSGDISWKQKSIDKRVNEYRRKVGFLSGNTKLYRRLTVSENMRYFGQLYGMTEQEIFVRTEKLAAQLELGNFIDRRADELSTGMYQRATLGRALIHDPELLILDEPTTGLDVKAAETVLEVMENEKSAGKTVIFSTHHMHEVERLCDEIVVINKGKCVFAGPQSGFWKSKKRVDSIKPC
ncbi:ABC transporter [Veronia nyctiphanis]|uniref:ABC transporter n=1 Tax=Veronia nyctiphanis TaxID=1278244 RepID=A0A4Q0YSB0_9GAMM|nr:ATP-binding cassette domain-containing protein [Veronia nyctiphanis]RXJ71989.1 ABC transporter [Veronia nyctiphanis]